MDFSLLLEEYNLEWKQSEENEIKIILGLAPYKQKVGDSLLRVDVPNDSYYGFTEVAFFVNKWMKVQDSLEMIFNLFFEAKYSLAFLNYLKKSSIDPYEFANYLLEKHNVLLINFYDAKGEENVQKIQNLLEKEKEKEIKILAVGKKAEEFAEKINNKFSSCEVNGVIHPSGNNIIIKAQTKAQTKAKAKKMKHETYYENWYENKINGDSSFLSNFRLIKTRLK